MTAWTLLLWTLAAAMMPTDAFTAGNETALRTQLLTNYNTGVRPDDVTSVVLTFLPTSLGELDIKSQDKEISGWWIMHWNDSRLSWDPTSYDDINTTHFLSESVWTPPVVVYNSVDDLSAISEDTIPMRVTSSGTVHWSPSAIMTVSCTVDVTYFPFDSQICAISVTTFGYTLAELELSPMGVNTSFYHESGEWELMDTYTKIESRDNSFVDFVFVFRRLPGYFGLNMIMPVLLTWLLSCFIFVLPMASAARLGYAMTMMLTFAVLMSSIASRMPSTSDHISCFEMYIVLVLTFLILAVIYTILNLDMTHREDAQPIPGCLRRLGLRLKRGSPRQGPSKDDLCPREGSDQDAATWATHSAKKGQRSRATVSDVEGAETAENAELTWKELAFELDAIALKTYLIATTLASVITFVVMGANY